MFDQISRCNSTAKAYRGMHLRRFGNIVPCVYSPVLAKHSKHLSFVDAINRSTSASPAGKVNVFSIVLVGDGNHGRSALLGSTRRLRRLRDEHQREKQQGQGGDDRDTSHRALSFCNKVWIAGGHEGARSRENCQSEPESGSVAVWIDRYFGRARLQGLPYLSG